jgi:hypothetical protein
LGSPAPSPRSWTVEPGRVKRRPKNFAKLKAPRAEARRRLMKDAARKGPKT